MPEIKRFVTNPIGENCYIVWDETGEAAIIDCGAWGEAQETKIKDFIEQHQLVPKLALQTHMHFDHILGLHFLHRQYGLQPQCHRAEQQVYDAAPAMARDWFQMHIPQPLVPVKDYLTDGQELTFGHTRIQVLHTPGHTPGGLMFHLPEARILFSGDTLFQGSVGRADLPGSSMEQEILSIRNQVLSLNNQTVIYPGHGPATTVGDERQMTPYLT